MDETQKRAVGFLSMFGVDLSLGPESTSEVAPTIFERLGDYREYKVPTKVPNIEHVLSLGVHPKGRMLMVLDKESGPETYILRDEALVGWSRSMRHMAEKDGVQLWPCYVEFGKEAGRTYAEIL